MSRTTSGGTGTTTIGGRQTGDRYEFASILARRLRERGQSLDGRLTQFIEGTLIIRAEEEVDANPTRAAEAQGAWVGFIDRMGDHAKGLARQVLEAEDVDYAMSKCGYWPWCYLFGAQQP